MPPKLKADSLSHRKPMSEINNLTISAALEGLRQREFSARELAAAAIQAAKDAQELNAYVLLTEEAALDQAQQADHRIAKGESLALDGIPIGIKDLFCTKNCRTTAASRILENYVPIYSATVAEKLDANGAVMIGKLNTDEFAMGSSNETSCWGPVINPWRAKDDPAPRSPGGSSGGPSASVAAGLCLGAIGTDTGGSLRQPAAFTGTVGLKPTYGRCSRWGIVAFASSLDQAGTITRSVEDAALMLQVIAGHDPKDATSADVPAFNANTHQSSDRLRVGIPKDYQLENLSPQIQSLWEQGVRWLKEQGAEIIDVSLPHTKYALPAYYIIAPAEASSNLARYDGVRYGLRKPGTNLTDMYAQTRAAGFGEEVKRRILIGTYALSAGYYDAYYLKALKVRAIIKQEFVSAFQDVDVLLTPATPSDAFPLGSQADPLDMYMNDVFTVPASLAGMPAMSVPVGLSEQGLPLSLQIIASHFDEANMLRAASLIEEAAGFSLRPEKWWGSK